MKSARRPAGSKSHPLQQIQKGGIKKSSTEVENQKVCTPKEGLRVDGDRLASLALSKAAPPPLTIETGAAEPTSADFAALQRAAPRRSLATIQPAASSPAVLVGSGRQPGSLLPPGPAGSARATKPSKSCTRRPGKASLPCRTSAAAADPPESTSPKQLRRGSGQRETAAVPPINECCLVPEKLDPVAAAEYERMFAVGFCASVVEEPLIHWELRAKALSEEVEALEIENGGLTEENAALHNKLESLLKQKEEEDALYSLMAELVDYTDYYDDTLKMVRNFALKELSRLEDQADEPP